MNNPNEGNSLKMILDYIKRIPKVIKFGFTTSCLPFLGCFAIVLVVIILILAITSNVFEWVGSITEESGSLGEILANFFDGNGWQTDKEYRYEQEKKYYEKLSAAYEKYNTDEFDNIKINITLITATLFYDKMGGQLQDDFVSPSCDPNDDTNDCAVNSDQEIGDFYRNARSYVFTLAKYMVVYNDEEIHCTNYCDPNNPYYPGDSSAALPEVCTKGYITTTAGTIRMEPDGSKFLEECANENLINNGALSDECESAAARELAEKPWEWGDKMQGLFEGYTTRKIYKTYQSNQDAAGNALMYPVCPYDNVTQKERDEIENACVNTSLYNSISNLYSTYMNSGCETSEKRPSDCDNLQSQMSEKESSLQSNGRFGSFVSIGYHQWNGTTCDFTCPSSFATTGGAECQQEEEEGYFSVEWKRYQVYYYKLMTPPNTFLNIGRENSFIEDYYADYISNNPDKREESIVEIVDGIYELLYTVIGSEQYYEQYIAGSGPNGMIDSYIPGDSGPWQTWTQSNQPWSALPLGASGASVSDAGCLVTSIAIQIARSGLWQGEFDPGVLVNILNQTGGFGGDGSLQWGPLRAVLPSGMSMHCDTEKGPVADCVPTIDGIKAQIDAGRYVVFRAKVAQHWVAVDYVKDGELYVYDPAFAHTTSLPLSQLASPTEYNGLNNIRYLAFSVSG